MGRIMGLADRFKTELKTQDIYSTSIEVTTPKLEIARMVTTPKDFSQDKFALLRKNLLSKINKTPYWNDYSAQSQEKMILKYFETKNKFNHTEYNKDDAIKFLNTVLKTTSN